MASPTEIKPAQLMRLIGTPDCPAIIDVRIDEDFDDDPRVIPGARRFPFLKASALVTMLGGASALVTCQKGLKLSQGVAAILRAEGVAAETLEGGHVAWRESGLPLIDWSKVPRRGADGHTLWVTRHRPKIDRIACPWLIRRFVDPGAKFLFVETGQVGPVAEKFGATPFDVENAFWSHRGDECTFDTMIRELGLEIDALNRLAVIVRAADTDRLDLAPQAAGLLAASLGLSRMYKDDLAQLEAGMALYDMFFRWARDASEEKHDWPAIGGTA